MKFFYGWLLMLIKAISRLRFGLKLFKKAEEKDFDKAKAMIEEIRKKLRPRRKVKGTYHYARVPPIDKTYRSL